ncbi:MAG: 23S rRNA (adenine(2503)-C(2))-methyltransferase RlmN [Elusimicrobia bacterium]|nr:23S rRNA (adenine(2503)-C(2))-methyltransferase RlmN [Elusimicrobiota bacterium]
MSIEPAITGKTQLLNLSFPEIQKRFQNSYRAVQVCEWIFKRRLSSFEGMSNIPSSLRQDLNRNYHVRTVRTIKKEESHLDRTIKFTFQTEDEKPFTAVFLPHAEYRSLCISSQVGCAWGCRFCASGLVPFERNLTAGEILEEIFLAEEETDQPIRNILFMGMGEPLANYSAVVQAIQWMISPHGLHKSPGCITVSTTGVAPQIRRLAEEKLQVNLALSLHASNESARKKILPISSKYKIQELLEACKIYQSKNSSDLTIEYILLDGINDSLQDASELCQTILSHRFDPQPKINLIPYNPVPSLPYQPTDKDKALSFSQEIKKKNFIVHLRKPQGLDIGAACGQLS